MRMIFYLITVLWKVCLSEALEIESNETVLIKEDIEGDHGLEKYANMTNVDHFFLTILGIIVFFMQCGFGFLEAGAVRSKNTVNILIKNWLDMCLGAIAYWAVGFGLTWGEFGNGFCGGSYYFGVNVPDYLLSKFFFQFTFAATASTLVSGALAERCNFIAYLVYCNLITGYIDYAGSGVVHLCGAVCAFMGAWLMGPRAGRFRDNQMVSMPGHSVPLAALGGLILVFGFLAQNVGKHGSLSQPGDGEVIAMAVTNTILATAMGGTSVLVFNKLLVDHQYSFLMVMNGSLTATVAVCAGCDRYPTWAALLLGLIAGPVFIGAEKMLLKMNIDDPVNAVPVNGVGGILGLLCAPLLRGDGKGLLFVWTYESLQLFCWNIVGMFCIIIWTGLTTGLVFWFLHRYDMLRVTLEYEFKGMDLLKHGESAYPADAWVEQQYMEDDLTAWSPSPSVKNEAGSNRSTTGAGGSGHKTGLPPNMKYNKHKSYNDPAQMFPGMSKMFGGIQGIIATDIQSRQSVLHTTIKRDNCKNEVNEENSDTEEEEKLMNCNLNKDEEALATDNKLKP